MQTNVQYWLIFMYHCTPKEHGMFIKIFCKFIRLSQQSYQLASKARVGNPVNVFKCQYSAKSVLILPLDPTCTTGDMWYDNQCYTLQIGLQAFNLLAPNAAYQWCAVWCSKCQTLSIGDGQFWPFLCSTQLVPAPNS